MQNMLQLPGRTGLALMMSMRAATLFGLSLTGASAFAPVAHGRSRLIGRMPMLAPTMQQPWPETPSPAHPSDPNMPGPFLVQRARLATPEQSFAALLMGAVVGLFARLRGPVREQSSAAATGRRGARVSQPVFLSGTQPGKAVLCEHVRDAEGSGEFWVCMSEVADDEYASRRVERDGRWVFYATRRWGI